MSYLWKEEGITELDVTVPYFAGSKKTTVRSCQF
jgi:hypothetical protein